MGTSTVEIIEDASRIPEIEEIWNRLAAGNPDVSVYSSFPFVATAWNHFKRRQDRLFVLVVKNKEVITALAPMRITTEKLIGGMPFRVIRFIAEWGNGDSPRLVTSGDERSAWQAIAHFLTFRHKAWDGIELAEQPDNAPVFACAFTDARRFFMRSFPASVSYHTSLKGSWEDYQWTLKARVKHNLKKCLKKAQQRGGLLELSCVDELPRIENALQRFISLEQTGWKKNRHFSVGGTPEQKAFHLDLARALARQGMIAFYFLTCGAHDIAASIVYRFKDTLYSAYVAYNPEWADCSPGMLLRAKVLEGNFTGAYGKYDYLGVQDTANNQSGKMYWATGRQERVHINIYKRGLRSLLYRAHILVTDIAGNMKGWLK